MFGDGDPSLVRWIAALDLPGGWFPEPVPEAQLDAYRMHPSASVLWFDCAVCGVLAPFTERGGGPSVVHLLACPHCGGSFGWQAFEKAHGHYHPMLGSELLAGRDPIGRPGRSPRGSDSRRD